MRRKLRLRTKFGGALPSVKQRVAELGLDTTEAYGSFWLTLGQAWADCWVFSGHGLYPTAVLLCLATALYLGLGLGPLGSTHISSPVAHEAVLSIGQSRSKNWMD